MLQQINSSDKLNLTTSIFIAFITIVATLSGVWITNNHNKEIQRINFERNIKKEEISKIENVISNISLLRATSSLSLLNSKESRDTGYTLFILNSSKVKSELLLLGIKEELVQDFIMDNIAVFKYRWKNNDTLDRKLKYDFKKSYDNIINILSKRKEKVRQSLLNP